MSQPFKIVHSLPGRVRIRLSDLYHQPHLAAGLEHCLKLEKGVHCVTANANAACVTVTFDDEHFVPDRWFSGLDWDHVTTTHRNHLKQVGLVSKHSPLRRAILTTGSTLPSKSPIWRQRSRTFFIMAGFPCVYHENCFACCHRAHFQSCSSERCSTSRKISADALDGTSLLVLISRGSFAPAGIMLSLISLGELIRD